jgi:hypothetical protein
MAKKKKSLGAKAKSTNMAPNSKAARRAANSASKEERRARKLALRKREKNGYTADMWAQPAPSHLVAKLDVPRVKSKYQSYFEFAANPEKKDKRLEFKASLPVSFYRSQLTFQRRSQMTRTHLQALCLYPSVTRY